MATQIPESRAQRDFRWVFAAVSIGMILLDQLVKLWARQTFSSNLAALQGKPFPGVFEFTLTYNRGIAFGLLQGHGVMLTPVAILMAGMAAFYAYKVPRGHLGVQVAMGLLAAGALGNLYDRVFEGRVTDIFYFRLINFPVFNIADACITVAAILLVIYWSIDPIVAKKEKGVNAVNVAPTASPENPANPV